MLFLRAIIAYFTLIFPLTLNTIPLLLNINLLKCRIARDYPNVNSLEKTMGQSASLSGYAFGSMGNITQNTKLPRLGLFINAYHKNISLTLNSVLLQKPP